MASRGIPVSGGIGTAVDEKGGKVLDGRRPEQHFLLSLQLWYWKKSGDSLWDLYAAVFCEGGKKQCEFIPKRRNQKEFPHKKVRNKKIEI